MATCKTSWLAGPFNLLHQVNPKKTKFYSSFTWFYWANSQNAGPIVVMPYRVFVLVLILSCGINNIGPTLARLKI
jgi:hypothetical protein